MIKLIVGLGNPGVEYRATRHNAGFWLIDLLVNDANTQLHQDHRFHGYLARATIAGQMLWLLKPLTFMNHSGRAVAALAHFYQITPSEILVIHDELDMPSGRARFKLGGGHGGHNGLKDITALLGDPGFWRLRIGIGHPRDRSASTKQYQQDVAAYVLSPPSLEEQIDIDRAMMRSQQALPLLLSGDSSAAMQKLHIE